MMKFTIPEKTKSLKKGDLANVPNSELREVVLDWIWNKLDENCSNPFELIDSLPKPCKNVYACCLVYDEVNNGGLNQLFYNPYREFAVMGQEGFRDLGSERLYTFMKKAIEIYVNNRELLEKYDDGTLESFSKSYDEKLFNELDNAFYEEEPEFDNLLEAYIRKNENFFGD